MKKIIIAIDGPAGAGKTTIAKALSKKFDVLYLNTGALYRAYAYKFVKDDLDINDPEVAELVAKKANIDVKYINGEQHTFLDDEDVSDKLHTDLISKMASTVSQYPIIRKTLIGIQQNIAQKQSVIMDGRDIGSVVLPMADYKFYLDADVKIRAERRYKEYLKKGIQTSYEKILEDMKNRDFNDTNRAISPLKKCKDSIVIDCTNLSIEQVVEKFLEYIKGN